ncbi:ThuA domain-containing protein [Nocardioides sp. zg-1228]|uniref:ThuA domain-containing protein n=1 Tax=Nocardioides sp. zg-1228 TaxID=2763008 RepID=UPI001F11DFBB|nr:ThuA domain-containing protein [Nocardioides sp. zg-1228]
MPTSFAPAVALAAALAVAGGVAPPVSAAPVAAAAPADDGVLRVLLFYKTGYHASWDEGVQAIRDLAADLGEEYDQEVQIQATEDPAAFNTANLATVDTVSFMQTGGVLFNLEQRAALEEYIRGGGGFTGMHYTGWSVGQSEHDVNPFYLRLVGAMSEGHPEDPGVRPGDVVVEDEEHPLTEGLPSRVNRQDEWYDWTVNPAPHVRTLVEADEFSYGMGRQGTTHPITWCQEIDDGRSWYSGLGHTETSYAEPYIRTQMKHGLAYAAGLLEADCSPPVKDEEGSWSGVVPWPLMPINMALTTDGKVQSFGSKGGQGGPGAFDWTGDESIYQGGQVEIDIWDPAEPRSMDMTRAELRAGIIENATYTDLFCSMQVQSPHTKKVLTVGGDDGLGENAPNDASMGVTSYDTNNGLQNEAPMHYARWYPTGTTMPDGSVVVQGGSLSGGPGGPGVLTPEVYTPDEGASWRLLTGAKSEAAYGRHQNRWWYPRAFVTPGKGTLFNITGTQMYELDPDGNDGTGELTLISELPANIANQGAQGNPVGATSTAAMYRPGKILQVGGGWWANGGGPDGARAGFTVDLTTPGGTASPVIEPTEPMKYQRHWANSTILPDGDVLVTGGSRQNAENGGYVTNAEIWNPDTGKWTTIEVPYEHARLYHSAALLLPDGRVMIGGGGAPGPRNYTDVEYYSPAYLFDGDELAERPEITEAPQEIGYDGTFQIEASTPVSRVTLVRNGSVTHSFNNDQNFQDLDFVQGPDGITVTSPVDATYAPPGAYMLFVFDEDGTPSVASILDIDPTVTMDQRTPQVVEMFEYPRFPGNAGAIADIAPDSGRMAPWNVDSQVQLVPAQHASQGALGKVGYSLALGQSGALSRVVPGLDPGRDYRIHLRYARDSRSAAPAGPANARVAIGSLDHTLTAGTDLPSQGNGQEVVYGTWVSSFTASRRNETLRLEAGDGDAGMMIDNLVITAVDPGTGDVAVHYEFEEQEGRTAANTGTDRSVGSAELTGETGWAADGVIGGALDLPGGPNANTADLPDNLLRGADDFTTSFWVRPDTMGDWINLFHIGDGLGDAGSFFQIQMRTSGGDRGLAATFKAKGSNLQERVQAPDEVDVVQGQWNHVVFTRKGATGTLYLNGEVIAAEDDLTIDMGDVGPTANNWLGRNGYVDDPSFDGLMDDVRLYESTLTQADVTSLHEEGTALETTTTLTVTPESPSPFNEPLTVSATVTDEVPGDPEGEAELWVDGGRIGVPVDVVDGAVAFLPLTLGQGQHEIEVRFVAGEGWRDSQASTTHIVSRPPPSAGIPVHYRFDEGQGTSVHNSGIDASVGAATLVQGAGWGTGQCAGAVSLNGTGHVNLPNNITAGMDAEFSLSTWIRPTDLPDWTTHVQIGKSTQEYLLIQSSTFGGDRGFAATLRVDNGTDHRIQLPGEGDLPLNEWTHVVVTLGPSADGPGTVGRIYFDGELMAQNTIPVDMGDVGEDGTTANFIGNTSYPDPKPTELVDDFRIYGYELDADQVAEVATCPPPNRAPVGGADAYGTDEGTPLTVAAPGVLGNDTDADEDSLIATGLTQPTDGTVVLGADGSFTYTPRAGFSGTDTFTYRVSDRIASSSAATTVTITVRKAEVPPVNRAPVGQPDAFNAVEGAPLVLPAPGVLGNDTDADGDSLSATGLTQPANGTVVLGADGSFTYTPRAAYSGTDLFTYRASDGTATSAATTVTITVKKAAGGGPGQPGDGPATTAVAGAALPVTYGASGSVSVTVSPETASGTVELRKDGALVATAAVAGGRGTVVLPPRSLPVGQHVLTLRYAGNASHRASSADVTVVVDPGPTRKARSRTVVTIKPEVLTWKRDFRVVAKVASLRGVPARGKVQIRIDGRLVTVARLDKKGRYVLKVERNLKVGRHWVSVTYRGNASTSGSQVREWFWVR